MISQGNLHKAQVGPTKIYSHNDADGIASAMIAKYVLPQAKVQLIDYGREHDALSVEQGLIFLDITPPPDRCQEFLDAGTIVLDHHKKREYIIRTFVDAGQGAFADEDKDPGVSGALLAYQHLLVPLNETLTQNQLNKVHEFARMVGIRDTWLKTHPAWSVAQATCRVLEFMPLDHWLDGMVPVIDHEQLNLGYTLVEKRMEEVKAAFKDAIVFTLDSGHQVGFVISDYKLSSDLGEYARQKGIGTFVTITPNTKAGHLGARVSLRSNELDVGAIAASQTGGGGHTSASGFHIDFGDLTTLTEMINPVKLVLDIIETNAVIQ